MFGRDPRARASVYAVPGATHTTRELSLSAGVQAQQLPLAQEKVIVIEPQRAGDMSLFNAAIGTTSIQILTIPATTRTFLCIQNVSAAAIWVNFGSAAEVGTGLILSAGVPASNIAGGSIFFDAWVPQGDVYAIATAAASQIVVSYSNKVL